MKNATLSASLARSIVRWFHAQRRDLPWRRTKDPYAIWVSEVMLQQTRVDVVVPFYERFLSRYPTVQSLARAPMDDVLAQWAGLGYYRRARQLKAAAESVVREHAGRIPEDEASLRSLPGVGRYTAGALRSIAFGKPAPIVDGNVARVLSRLFAIPGGPSSRERSAWEAGLWELATALVPASDPSAFNQGLMELGATVCLPRSPRCEVCPVARACKARSLGTQEEFPEARHEAPVTKVELWAFVLEHRGRYLLRERKDGEHNAGFWEFPTFVAPRRGRRCVEEFLARALSETLAPVSARARIEVAPAAGKPIRHGILRTEYRIVVRPAALLGPEKRAPATSRENGWRWVAAWELDERRLTSASRKVARVASPTSQVGGR
ncbi:MAG: A/G-specific adenine glycosylase [Candidatus Eiseniibacteriota bacterium]